MKLRKILPLIAVLLLMLVAIPLMVVSASAEDALTPSEGLAFEFTNKKQEAYKVTGIGDCADTDLVIPSTHNGLPVTMIGSEAFKSNKKLTSVYIPDSVTIIGDAAFRYCTNLSSVRLSQNITAIRGGMFQATALTEIVIPEGVHTIWGNAFWQCKSLTSVTLPSTLQKIYKNAFRNTGLTSVELPEGLTFLDYAAFKQTKLKTVVIPSTVKTISNKAFETCGSLNTVTIQEGTTAIGNYAFAECPFLKNVNLPSSLKSIGRSAFRVGKTQTSRLASITLPENLTTLGQTSFYRTPITSIVIPASVTTIGNDVFSGCANLTSIYYGGASEAEWNAINSGTSNSKLLNTARYYYSANDPQAEGYWHYDSKGKPVVWEVATVEKFTVTFNANGHGTAPAAQTIVSGEVATAPAALTATGYTFGGWYTDAACTKAYDFNTAVTGNVTLYAKWTVVTYTVTFDANGQGTAPAAQTVAYGNKATAPAALTAVGYEFGGWYTDAACTKAYDFDAAVTANVTLYAKWTPADTIIGGDPDSGDVEMPGIGI